MTSQQRIWKIFEEEQTFKGADHANDLNLSSNAETISTEKNKKAFTITRNWVEEVWIPFFF